MTTQEKINFRISRDFGEIFNVSVKFLRQNFKSFFICMLFLAGPFILMYSFCSAYHQSVVMHKLALVKAGRLYNMSTYGWEYFLSLFLQFLSSLSMMCTTYAYMLMYQEKGRDNFTVTDVAKRMNEVAGKIIGGFFLFFFLTMIFVIAVVAIAGIIIQSSPVLGTFVVILLLISVLLLGPNISWQISTAFLVIIADNEIPISSYGRTREVMKHNYWWTWLIMVCSSFLVFFLAILFVIPETIYSLVVAYSTAQQIEETSVFYIIVLVVCTFLATLVYSIIYIICGFHYFSLAEKKYGTGLMERINEIGKNKIETQQ